MSAEATGNTSFSSLDTSWKSYQDHPVMVQFYYFRVKLNLRGSVTNKKSNNSKTSRPRLHEPSSRQPRRLNNPWLHVLPGAALKSGSLQACRGPLTLEVAGLLYSVWNVPSLQNTAGMELTTPEVEEYPCFFYLCRK